MKALAFEQMDARHATIKRAQRLTCQWLLQHPTYLAWDSVDEIPQKRSIFWINGKPGAGKSTLLKFVYAHLKRRKKSRNEILISFFFNARGDELEKDTIGMYRSLLLQLLKEAPDLQQVLDEVDGAETVANYPPSWTLEILQELFASAVAGLGNRRVVCVIDALDECNEKQVRDMVAQFEDLAESAIDSGTRLRICFASRHYPEIRAQKALNMVLETEDGHSHDLEMFIRKQLDAGNGEHDEQIRTKIRQKSNGVFMWAVLVVDILNVEYRKGCMWAIEQKLEEIPDGLTELLRDILRRDNVDMDALLLCLQWIIFAKRPLKLEEFYCAMEAGLTDKPTQARHPERDKTQGMARFVTSSSKGLAELTKSDKPTVQFIHESVRDFLLKDGGLCELWPQLNGRVADISHDRLKQCCHKYMTVGISAFAPLGQPLPKATSSESAQLRAGVNEGFPFLDYASQSVLYHANEAALMVSQEMYLHQFPFTWWIHVTNVLQPVHKHRHGPNATLQYTLAETGFASLLDIIPHHGIWDRIKGERYGYPFIAAFANGQRLALGSLMDPNSSVSIEDLTKDKGFGKASQLNVGDDLWIWAWKTGNWNVAKYLLTSCSQALGWGASKIHDTVSDGRDALSFAAENGNGPVVEWLVGAGAHVNGFKGCKDLPLSWASGGNDPAAIEVLLDARADVNAQGGNYGSALQAACFQGDETIVQMLLDAGAEVNAQGGEYGNALQAACYMAFDTIVLTLLGAGANVNLQGGIFGSALHAASRLGHESIVQMLINSGADVNAPGVGRGSALDQAQLSKNARIVRMLRRAGATE
ncbi:hypothetical protein M409DRAFT_68480 [Zasmidium cellare ATCC 36951]|uniref:NACHT domain-containing protein n=1 Tax=Zasmidium cellare ATCC 36951 TaxID=1080233 RepID=A0A6A6CCD6_ZASCE|nr:uncharacterized protein M409DRAFT_68480 [Zasmidium cellare ATCC 36951]KAF2163582.1 hypothetical protein M409DRAFT_68480 [Zasmidium cellare ATCC 36951]